MTQAAGEIPTLFIGQTVVSLNLHTNGLFLIDLQTIAFLAFGTLGGRVELGTVLDLVLNALITA